MRVVTAPTVVRVDVVKAEVRPINPQHVNRKVMVPIEIVMILVGRGHNSDVCAV
jgi:hypothetical protein